MHAHAHSSGSAVLSCLAERGLTMFAAAHAMQTEAPVAVGRVVWPAGHGAQVLAETALTSAENLPAAQLAHLFAVPSLYRPGARAVQVVSHAGAEVSPLASLAVPLASHRTQAEALARLAVPGGQAWHAVLPAALENFPAAHAAQAVPEIMLPGAHALQAVTVPPGEYWVGRGHCVQAPAGLVYWPAGHAEARMEGVINDAMKKDASARTMPFRRFIFVSYRRGARLYRYFAGRMGCTAKMN